MKPEYYVQFRIGNRRWLTLREGIHFSLSAAKKHIRQARKSSERQGALKYRLVKLVEVE